MPANKAVIRRDLNTVISRKSNTPSNTTHFNMMDFTMHGDKISIELPILYFKGTQVDFLIMLDFCHDDVLDYFGNSLSNTSRRNFRFTFEPKAKTKLFAMYKLDY